MEVILANPRGFCAGVIRAIETVYRALSKYGAPVYILHEIVHNRHVLENLRDEGAVFVKNLEDIPKGGITIFSAHGVSKAVEEKAKHFGLITIDATCPLVSKVHRRVGSLSRQGYGLIMIGHAGHPEVEGTQGRTDAPVAVVSSCDDVERLQRQESQQQAFVTQTTLSMQDSSDIVSALKKRFPKIQGPEKTDICYATQNRQNAVKELAAEVDILFVVGSDNSSNSNRLRETGEKHGVASYLIDDADQIDKALLENVEKIGVTAGASAPDVLIQEVLERLKRYGVQNTKEIFGREEHVVFQSATLPEKP
jgi:4-hydroxy-3-methylbut-2-enyl diphosphate reductase